jgi:hypothetical protein
MSASDEHEKENGEAGNNPDTAYMYWCNKGNRRTRKCSEMHKGPATPNAGNFYRTYFLLVFSSSFELGLWLLDFLPCFVAKFWQ